MTAARCEVCEWDGQGDDPLTTGHGGGMPATSSRPCPGPELVALRARVAELEAKLASDPSAIPDWYRRMEAAGCHRTALAWWCHGRSVVWPDDFGFGFLPNGGSYNYGHSPTEEAACLAYLASIGAP